MSRCQLFSEKLCPVFLIFFLGVKNGNKESNTGCKSCSGKETVRKKSLLRKKQTSKE